ncbi:MAG: PDZ domain-containing protein [Bacteroidota bacterium]|nr:PDZ domain-containing protein [Bacteroidota bacterium]
MKNILNSLFVLSFLIIFGNVSAQDEVRLLRFPTIYENQIVFSYAGDLFTVDSEGGLARKMTNHEGYEMFARFSPDGKNIAFTGGYDGNREVYIMPAIGGEPQRITFTATLGRDDIADRMGPNNIVLTWKDNETVVFRSRKKSINSFVGQLFQANINGGISQQLPLPSGGFCSFSPDKNKFAYNRIMREFRTWKYYKGGMADDVWIFDFKTKKIQNITKNDNQDIIPMWYKNKIYYLSDRDRIMNIFVYDIGTAKTKKVTNFEKYDIKFPSLGKNAIVFENGGYIYKLELPSEKLSKVEIKIADDFIYSRKEIVDASKFIKGYSLSPDAKRLLFNARGEVFTVPTKHGFTRNLTKSSSSHERNSVWSPDGKYIAYLSDKSGEFEIYIIKKDGKEEAIQLTNNASTYKYNLDWSPDSKKIMWSDKELNLKYVDIESKKITVVDKALSWEIRSYNWSPDSKWICFSRPEVKTFSKIYLYELSTTKKHAVTEGWFNSGSPVFSDNGKYLFFTSSRDFNPIYSQTEWNHAYVDMSKIYFVTLSKETKSPFEPKNDETSIEQKDKEKSKEETKEVEVKIDIDGLQQRIINLPVKAASYYGLNPVGDKIYYGTRKYRDKSYLKYYDFEKQKEVNLGNYGSFQISNDKKKMLIAKSGKYYVINLPKAKISLKESLVDISELKVEINKEEEWQQIFDEAWRQMRDFFYDPGMHGLDWNVIYEKYNPLVKYVKHRDDLTYIIGEMIGELNIGHAYVGGGDKPKAKRIKTGLLGAELKKDKNGFYKINKLLDGQNWNNSLRSPLTEVGVNIEEGDYIIAVNGESTADMKNIYASLIGKAGKQVELTVNSKASESDSRDVIVVPIADESKLYYYNWVQENIRKVNEATDGKVGYIHIPDMGVAGLNEFVKYFYPQLGKKALIIDDRGNGGGNVSPMIIERLRREISRANVARNTVKTATPKQMLHGPMVCLINEYSASDGDLFPFQFKKHKLGKIIGKRSWGGVTGIRGSLPFVDGGILYKPEFGTYDENGWIIEGYGVDPDIVVDNDPAKEYAGIDQQLNKAIEIILKELKENPQEIPDVPDFPDKSK